MFTTKNFFTIRFLFTSSSPSYSLWSNM